jgi:hypothetical protein
MTSFAVLATIAALAAAPPQVVLHPDGRIGQFRIDVTTRAQVVAVLGNARTTVVASGPKKKRIGVRLDYSCGNGCEMVFSFSDKTGRLSDFATSAPFYTTERGSHVGMSAASAAKLEGKPLVPACSPGKVIRVRWDATHKFGISTLQGVVKTIAYIGPHSTYDKPFC